MARNFSRTTKLHWGGRKIKDEERKRRSKETSKKVRRRRTGDLATLY